MAAQEEAVHVPSGARPGARILLFDPEDRLLLFQVRNPVPLQIFWVTPSGGVEPGETFPEAARRELWEETGLDAEIGPCVWFREHRYPWNGHECHLYERFFVARTANQNVAPVKPDEYTITHRWWTLSELAMTLEIVVPRRLAVLLDNLLRGELPQIPINTGE